MANATENAQNVIDILKGANTEIGELLKDTPDMYLQINSVLKRLINGTAHAHGLSIDETPAFKEEKIMLTHIAGVPITAPVQVSIESATPTPSEAEQLQDIVDAAYDDITGLDSETVIEMYNDLIIRGVAAKAGIEVTPTTPATITTAFVDQIKATIAAKDAPAPEARKETIKPPTKRK